MRVALDATYALDPEPSGVARYSRGILRALAEAEPGLEMVLCARARRFAALRRDFPPPRFRHCLLQEPLNFRLPRRVDLFHGLNQRLPRYRFRRQVVTVHDVFPLSSERYSSVDFRRRFSGIIRDAVERADALIAVSAYTRDQLCLHLAVDPARVTVVHHGVDIPPPPAPSLQPPASRFLLIVGAVQVRKNVLAAVRALERLPRTVRLVVVGGAGHGAEEVRDYVRAHNLAQRVEFPGYVNETRLGELYAQAAALVFPSLEEGFGLPVLEAMARGLPVVAARAGALPEVAGDAAVLVAPEDVEGLAEACRRVLEDSTLAANLVARGLARAREFTWEKAARATLAVYERC